MHQRMSDTRPAKDRFNDDDAFDQRHELQTQIGDEGHRDIAQFLMALVLIVLIAVQLRWLPAAGHGEARHFILPSLTLALGLAAVNARIARDAMARIAEMPFWRFAQWKGLSQPQTLIRHGLRHRLQPRGDDQQHAIQESASPEPGQNPQRWSDQQ
ncbi:Binding-protein-dependent transport system inner membrane component [Paracoccus seriniphilus]|uniref:Binding-protein-dependent transport system inner membrane component n=1 Tax=Paracoccus seriniphilus TaxID=184748 RepID=A0A239PRA2_9RHOB|nr:Binding-protein-dependent transport system inner membrane component [Paracoccus seriniphilus]